MGKILIKFLSLIPDSLACLISGHEFVRERFEGERKKQDWRLRCLRCNLLTPGFKHECKIEKEH